MPPSSEVTTLLEQWRKGDRGALDQMLPLVYGELREIASGYMRSERADHTLQATALVHEAYARLVDADVDWQDRGHFFSVAARAMRRILVDHARAHRSAKRGGDAVRVTLPDDLVASGDPTAVIDLDDALSRLAKFDERKVQALELHYFSGLTYEETAKAMSSSAATVHRELRIAKAWLHRELSSGQNEPS